MTRNRKIAAGRRAFVLHPKDETTVMVTIISDIIPADDLNPELVRVVRIDNTEHRDSDLFAYAQVWYASVEEVTAGLV